jgi:transcriptional regulator with XRE-family HTH domain
MKKQTVGEREVFLKSIGKAIHKRRNQLGISQEGLAYKADLNRAYLSDIERGERNISVYTLKKITEALDITMTEIFKNWN